MLEVYCAKMLYGVHAEQRKCKSQMKQCLDAGNCIYGTTVHERHDED